MGPGSFLRTHLWPSLIMAAGVIWASIGFIDQAHDVMTAGLKPWQMQLSGFLIFVIGVVSMLYRFHQASTGGAASKTTPPMPPIDPGSVLGQALSGPVAPPEKPVRKGARTYCPQSFVDKYLTFLNGNYTEIQEEGMLKPHLGQWVRISGHLRNVSASTDTIIVYVTQSKDYSKAGAKFYFSKKKWANHLSLVSIGDRIEVDAQIVDQPFVGVRLCNAELL